MRQHNQEQQARLECRAEQMQSLIKVFLAESLFLRKNMRQQFQPKKQELLTQERGLLCSRQVLVS